MAEMRRWDVLRSLLCATACLAVVSLAGCAGGSAAQSKAGLSTSVSSTAASASASSSAGNGSSSPTKGPTTSGPTVATGWNPPTTNPDIAAAQSKIGNIGSTLLAWSTAAGSVGVSVDYLIPYVPTSEFVLPAGTHGIELDVRIINASPTPVNLSGWSIYANLGSTPATPIEDSRYVAITDLPAIAPNANAYIRARIEVPTTATTLVIGIVNSAFPGQPATFGATLS
jgi:hypothetical protein